MAKIGATIEEMTALKTRFDRESATVQQLRSSIESQLTSTWWVGPAADRFRNAWASEYRPALQRLSQALTEAGAEVDKRRNAIVNAGS